VDLVASADQAARKIGHEGLRASALRLAGGRGGLAREERTIDTEFGPVRIKVVRAPSGIRARVEYDEAH